MAVNRAIQPIKKQGEPLENFVLTTLPKPAASSKNVVVRVVLRPVNPTDLLASRLGSWAHLDKGRRRRIRRSRSGRKGWRRSHETKGWTEGDTIDMEPRLQIPQGEYFLQTGAGSVLARQLVALAKHHGIKTINVVRRDEWIQPLKDIGADYVINSSKEDVKAKVLEITAGKGAYGAVDAVATESTML